LFSSLTLNMALGSVSVTTAITSIASSFDKPHPILPAHPRGDSGLVTYSVKTLAPVAVTATVCSK